MQLAQRNLFSFSFQSPDLFCDCPTEKFLAQLIPLVLALYTKRDLAAKAHEDCCGALEFWKSLPQAKQNLWSPRVLGRKSETNKKNISKNLAVTWFTQAIT